MCHIMKRSKQSCSLLPLMLQSCQFKWHPVTDRSFHLCSIEYSLPLVRWTELFVLTSQLKDYEVTSAKLMLFENSMNKIMITIHPVQWRSMVFLIDFVLYPVWKMIAEYWIKKPHYLDSVCSSPCSACALPFLLRVKQVYGVAGVWQGSVWHSVFEGGSRWLSKGKPADTPVKWCL